MSSRAEIESPAKRARERRRRRLIARLIIVVILILLLIGGVIALARWSRVLISNIEVMGNQTVSSEEVTALLENNLVGNYWWVFPKRNVALYPRTKLEDILRQYFPRLAEVHIVATSLNTLLVQVAERRGVALWCHQAEIALAGNVASSTIASPSNECYFIDQTGLIISLAPEFSDQIFFEIRGGLPTATTIPLGQQLLPAERFTALLTFKNDLATLLSVTFGHQVDLNQVLLDDGGAYLLATVHGSPATPNFKILFDENGDWSASLLAARAALATPGLRGQLMSPAHPLEYLDLRLPTKVFYKFQQ